MHRDPPAGHAAFNVFHGRKNTQTMRKRQVERQRSEMHCLCFSFRHSFVSYHYKTFCYSPFVIFFDYHRNTFWNAEYKRDLQPGKQTTGSQENRCTGFVE